MSDNLTDEQRLALRAAMIRLFDLIDSHLARRDVDAARLDLARLRSIFKEPKK